MRLYSWNVNGIRAIAKKGLPAWMETERMDVLCLQETKADPAQLDDALRRPAGYHSYWAWAERKGYSGVATYCRKAANAYQPGLGIERFDREGRVLRTDHGDFELYNVYFPNGKANAERLAYKLDFYAAFLAHINARIAVGKAVLFCGDLNTAHQAIDLARPRENARISGFLPEERAWIDRYTEQGWVDVFRHFHPDARDAYSWWSLRTGARARNIGWRLDCFFMHRDMLPRVRDAGIAVEVMGADHCPVWIELKE